MLHETRDKKAKATKNKNNKMEIQETRDQRVEARGKRPDPNDKIQVTRGKRQDTSDK